MVQNLQPFSDRTVLASSHLSVKTALAERKSFEAVVTRQHKPISSRESVDKPDLSRATSQQDKKANRTSFHAALSLFAGLERTEDKAEDTNTVEDTKITEEDIIKTLSLLDKKEINKDHSDSTTSLSNCVKTNVSTISVSSERKLESKTTQTDSCLLKQTPTKDELPVRTSSKDIIQRLHKDEVAPPRRGEVIVPPPVLVDPRVRHDYENVYRNQISSDGVSTKLYVKPSIHPSHKLSIHTPVQRSTPPAASHPTKYSHPVKPVQRPSLTLQQPSSLQYTIKPYNSQYPSSDLFWKPNPYIQQSSYKKPAVLSTKVYSKGSSNNNSDVYIKGYTHQHHHQQNDVYEQSTLV